MKFNKKTIIRCIGCAAPSLSLFLSLTNSLTLGRARIFRIPLNIHIILN